MREDNDDIHNSIWNQIREAYTHFKIPTYPKDTIIPVEKKQYIVYNFVFNFVYNFVFNFVYNFVLNFA